jgi:Protein of unknown function (DUF3833)
MAYSFVSVRELVQQQFERVDCLMASDTTQTSEPPAARTLFDITRFLAGRTRASGVFEDRFGRVRRQFSADMVGAWEGETFVLKEDFSYSDGETEQRIWRIRSGEAGAFTATCDDCIGVASGQSADQSWRMRYDFRLRLKRRMLVVTFDDRVHRLDARRAINRATISKWGIRLGDVCLVMEKLDAAHAQQTAEPTAA